MVIFHVSAAPEDNKENDFTPLSPAYRTPKSPVKSGIPNNDFSLTQTPAFNLPPSVTSTPVINHSRDKSKQFIHRQNSAFQDLEFNIVHKDKSLLGKCYDYKQLQELQIPFTLQ